MKKNVYLERYAWSKATLLASPPSVSTKLIITIPCYNEPNLIQTLNSLYQCEVSESFHTEVLVLINNGEHASTSVREQNKSTYQDAISWVKNHSSPHLTYHILLEESLPQKHAGVGLARKIIMDEAVRRFQQTTIQDNGVIVCFDADSICESNYLIELEKHFSDLSINGCSIHYEHPEAETPILTAGIQHYELHLRYYINALKFSGLPFAHQTIGSSMAVRSSIYQKQGGMPKKKAGEDFYFLNKIIPLGGFKDLTTTTVIPSPRLSDRVPFGTGKAQQNWLNNNAESYESYRFNTFLDLKELFSSIEKTSQYDEMEYKTWYQSLPSSIQAFLPFSDFLFELKRIQKHSKTVSVYLHRFFLWFDAFKCMKFAHFCRDHFYPNTNLLHEAKVLLSQHNEYNTTNADLKELLETYRQIDKNATEFIL